MHSGLLPLRRSEKPDSRRSDNHTASRMVMFGTKPAMRALTLTSCDEVSAVRAPEHHRSGFPASIVCQKEASVGSPLQDSQRTLPVSSRARVSPATTLNRRCRSGMGGILHCASPRATVRERVNMREAKTGSPGRECHLCRQLRTEARGRLSGGTLYLLRPTTAMSRKLTGSCTAQTFPCVRSTSVRSPSVSSVFFSSR